MLLYLIDIIGTVAFAVSGVLLAFKLRLDAVGVIVLASVTAIGGGTMRDMILNVPVFWLNNDQYIFIIIATCFAMIFFIKKPTKVPKFMLPFFDAIGLGLFAIVGAEKALNLGFSPTVAVIMGTLTGCGGGVIRDMFGGQIPIIFQKEIYATACIVGTIIYCIMEYIGISSQINVILGIVIVVLIRLLALKWELSLPNFYQNNIKN